MVLGFSLLVLKLQQIYQERSQELLKTCKRVQVFQFETVTRICWQLGSTKYPKRVVTIPLFDVQQ